MFRKGVLGFVLGRTFAATQALRPSKRVSYDMNEIPIIPKDVPQPVSTYLHPFPPILQARLYATSSHLSNSFSNPTLSYFQLFFSTPSVQRKLVEGFENVKGLKPFSIAFEVLTVSRFSCLRLAAATKNCLFCSFFYITNTWIHVLVTSYLRCCCIVLEYMGRNLPPLRIIPLRYDSEQAIGVPRLIIQG